MYIYINKIIQRPYPNVHHSFSWKSTAFEAPLRVPEDSSQAPEVLGGEIGIHQRLESGLDPAVAVGCFLLRLQLGINMRNMKKWDWVNCWLALK